MVLGAAACSGSTSPGRDAAPAATATTVVAREPAPAGFRAVTVSIRTADGDTVTRCLLLADDDARRAQGLMGVTDASLGGYDGMLFAFDRDTTNGFWMKDTLIPLSIGFLDAGGAVVDTADMVPCPSGTERCPTTTPSAPYRFAVEVPAGRLGAVGLTDGAHLDPRLDASCTRG